MEYSDQYLREQLPPENPRPELVPGDVSHEIATYIERGDFGDPGLLTLSVRWTYAIFFELGLGNYRWRGHRRPWELFEWGFLADGLLRSVSIGLYDPDREEKGFGLAINVPGWDGPSFYIVASIYFPRLGQSFPLAIRTTETELHAAPNPVNATTACWAQCNGSNNWESYSRPRDSYQHGRRRDPSGRWKRWRIAPIVLAANRRSLCADHGARSESRRAANPKFPRRRNPGCCGVPGGCTTPDGRRCLQLARLLQNALVPCPLLSRYSLCSGRFGERLCAFRQGRRVGSISERNPHLTLVGHRAEY